MIFEDRFEAGKLLAEKLTGYKNKKDAIVLAIPRGGLEIGYQLAKQLNLKLDIVITKKIGAPYNEELAAGAVGPEKTIFLNQDVVELYNIPQNYIQKEAKRLWKKVEERYSLYRGNKNLPELKNKTVIITDDGVATGATIIAAVEYVRVQKPKKIVVAVPVCPEESLFQIRQLANEVIYLSTDLVWGAIGACYRYFPQVDDEKAIKYLRGTV